MALPDRRSVATKKHQAVQPPDDEQESRLAFKYQDEVHELDPQSLTLDEQEVIEDHLGQLVEEIDFRKKRALKCLAYIAISRTHPSFTLSDAGALTMDALDVAEGSERPTNGAGSSAEPANAGTPS
jgi:predicted lipoprotein